MTKTAKIEFIISRKYGIISLISEGGIFTVKNCEMRLNGDILTITVDVSKEFGKSSTGKNIIISSTEGNVSIPEKEDIKIGLNIYRKP